MSAPAVYGGQGPVAATRSSLRGLSIPPQLLTLAAAGAATLTGLAMAVALPRGLAIWVALIFVPLVLLDLQIGLALWLPLIFVQALPVVGLAANAAGVLVLLAWLGTRRRAGAPSIAATTEERRMLGAGLLLLAWLAGSALWADSVHYVLADLWQWAVGILLLAIAMTVLRDQRGVRLLVWGFVIGGTISVTVGLVAGGIGADSPALETATATEGRLQGGAGDPNYLAAGLLPAIVMAAGLAAGTRGVLRRLGLVVCAGIMAIGLAATQSRGGMVAAVLIALAAPFVFRGRRLAATSLVLLVGCFAGLWFAADPTAWQRVTSFNNGGNGRSSIWSVAWRLSGDYPLLGVGLNNFRVHSGDYVRQPGALDFVQLIVERPHVVHNIYLQMLAETGPLGLALFVFLIAAAIRAAWMAASRFHRAGDESMATLARSVALGIAGIAIASFFISNGADRRLWLLLALGPALASISKRAGAVR